MVKANHCSNVSDNPEAETTAEPEPNGGRINLGYDGDTAAAATSPSATSVQVYNPTGLQKLQVGVPTTFSMSFETGARFSRSTLLVGIDLS